MIVASSLVECHIVTNKSYLYRYIMSKYYAFIITRTEAEKSYERPDFLVSNIMDMNNYLICESLMMYVNKDEYRAGIIEKRFTSNERWDSSKSLQDNLKKGLLKCQIKQATSHSNEENMRTYLEERQGQLIFEFGKKFPTHIYRGMRFRQHFETFNFY